MYLRSKYKDLEFEVSKRCHMRTSTIPDLVGALGMNGQVSDRLINGIHCSPRHNVIKKIVFTSTDHTI